MGAREPMWYYVGEGQLRYKDGDGWTDQYKTIDEPEAAAQPASTESLDPSHAHTSSDVGRHRRGPSHLRMAIFAALLGLGVVGGLLEPDAVQGLVARATNLTSHNSAPTSPTSPSTPAVSGAAKVKAKARPPLRVTPPQTVGPKTALLPAQPIR
jgi:hypothetical protein